jgi:plasmid stabilization system protein ParE
MAYKLSVTELAHEDLSNIISYMAVELSNKPAAVQFIGEVEKCYDRLKENPLIYEECRDPRLKMMGYRKVVVNHYVLIYKIDEKAKTVIVYRFFYGRQDYAKLI